MVRIAIENAIKANSANSAESAEIIISGQDATSRDDDLGDISPRPSPPMLEAEALPAGAQDKEEGAPPAGARAAPIPLLDDESNLLEPLAQEDEDLLQEEGQEEMDMVTEQQDHLLTQDTQDLEDAEFDQYSVREPVLPAST